MNTALLPRGFRVAGVHCGIKADRDKNDLCLCLADAPAVAAGVYTKNRVVAAPVVIDRARTPAANIRAIVANSGNANACTGARGMEDARRMASLAAEACGVGPEQVLILSTGIIGEHLPMENIAGGISASAAQLGDDEAALVSAAEGLMTTDTYHKLAGRELSLGGAGGAGDTNTLRIAGMAKGAGMIGPNMATMLAIVLTDARLTPDTAQDALTAAVDESFNCISVEGHTSTNDTVLLLASGNANDSEDSEPLKGDDLAAFGRSLTEVCCELAKSIPNDGEGASHLITVDVSGAATRADAHALAKAVANSLLVKTAVAGGDPNWGRIVSAAGYAGVDFDPAGISLSVNGTLLYTKGVPIEHDVAAVSASLKQNREAELKLEFSEGRAAVRFWTSDLTREYVRFNSEFHT